MLSWRVYGVVFCEHDNLWMNFELINRTVIREPIGP